MAKASETAGEAVSGIRTVKSFRTEVGEAHRYDVRLMETHNLKTQRDTVRAIYLLVRRVSMSWLFILKCICVYFLWRKLVDMELHCCGSFLLNHACGLQMAELGMKVAMLYYGRLFIQYGQMSIGNLVSFILYQQDLGDNIRVCLCLF